MLVLAHVPHIFVMESRLLLIGSYSNIKAIVVLGILAELFWNPTMLIKLMRHLVIVFHEANHVFVRVLEPIPDEQLFFGAVVFGVNEQSIEFKYLPFVLVKVVFLVV